MNYLKSDQRHLLLNSVIKSQLTYWLLILMFTSRYLNNALNNIHKLALGLIYKDHEKSFNSILTENNLNSNKKHLEFLAIKIYKFQNGLSPSIMNDILISRQNIYNLQKFQELSISTKNTVKFGTKTYSGPQLWNLIPDSRKPESTLEPFKKKIRTWKCETCPCTTCETYLQHMLRFCQLIEILALILPMVRTNLFCFVPKHCIGWLEVDFN